MSSDLLSWLRSTIEGDKAAEEKLIARAHRLGHTVLQGAHSPQETIARCEAELRLLDLHEHVETSSLSRRLVGGKCQPFGCALCHEKDQIVWGEGVCETVRLLAAGRRHREGFNPEWVA